MGKINVSIIVATYNSTKKIKRCLNSIVEQLDEGSEIIIVDGNSSDDTMEIVRSYGDKVAYSISEPDEGIYDAWNKGIRVARGEWITFIGSDDVMLPGAIQNYYRFFQMHGTNFDIVCGKLHFVDDNEHVIRDVGEPWDWNRFVRRKMSLAHPGLLHNRRCFEKIGFFDTQYKICADSDFLQRLGPNIQSGFIDAYLVNMTQGGISDSMKAIQEGYLSRKRNRVLSPMENLLCFWEIIVRMKLGKMRNYICKGF